MGVRRAKNRLPRPPLLSPLLSRLFPLVSRLSPFSPFVSRLLSLLCHLSPSSSLVSRLFSLSRLLGLGYDGAHVVEEHGLDNEHTGRAAPGAGLVHLGVDDLARDKELQLTLDPLGRAAVNRSKAACSCWLIDMGVLS